MALQPMSYSSFTAVSVASIIPGAAQRFTTQVRCQKQTGTDKFVRDVKGGEAANMLSYENRVE